MPSPHDIGIHMEQLDIESINDGHTPIESNVERAPAIESSDALVHALESNNVMADLESSVAQPQTKNSGNIPAIAHSSSVSGSSHRSSSKPASSSSMIDLTKPEPPKNVEEVVQSYSQWQENQDANDEPEGPPSANPPLQLGDVPDFKALARPKEDLSPKPVTEQPISQVPAIAHLMPKSQSEKRDEKLKRIAEKLNKIDIKKPAITRQKT